MNPLDEKQTLSRCEQIYTVHGFAAVLDYTQSLGIPESFCQYCDNETPTLTNTCCVCGSNKATNPTKEKIIEALGNYEGVEFIVTSELIKFIRSIQD